MVVKRRVELSDLLGEEPDTFTRAIASMPTWACFDCVYDGSGIAYDLLARVRADPDASGIGLTRVRGVLARTFSDARIPYRFVVQLDGRIVHGGPPPARVRGTVEHRRIDADESWIEPTYELFFEGNG